MTPIGTVDPPESARWNGRTWDPVVDVIAGLEGTVDELTTELEASGQKISADERSKIVAWITSSNGLMLLLVFVAGMFVSGWLVAERNFNIYSTVLDGGGGPTSVVVVEADTGSTLPGADDQTPTPTVTVTVPPTTSSVPTAQPVNPSTTLPSGTSVDDTEFLPNTESSAQTLPSTP